MVKNYFKLRPVLRKCDKIYFKLQHVFQNPTNTHHVDSTLKRRENGHFHVVSSWNPRGVFVNNMTKSYFKLRQVLSNYNKIYFNPLRHGVAFLYPLKTSESLKALGYFQGV